MTYRLNPPPPPRGPGCLTVTFVWATMLVFNVAWIALLVWVVVWVLRTSGVL